MIIIRMITQSNCGGEGQDHSAATRSSPQNLTTGDDLLCGAKNIKKFDMVKWIDPRIVNLGRNLP